jgi:hypothetical protein
LVQQGQFLLLLPAELLPGFPPQLAS